MKTILDNGLRDCILALLTASHGDGPPQQAGLFGASSIRRQISHSLYDLPRTVVPIKRINERGHGNQQTYGPSGTSKRITSRTLIPARPTGRTVAPRRPITTHTQAAPRRTPPRAAIRIRPTTARIPTHHDLRLERLPTALLC